MKYNIRVVFYLILFFISFISDGFTAKKKYSKSSRRSASSSKGKSARRSASSLKTKNKKVKSSSKSKSKDKTKSKTSNEKEKSKEDLTKEKEIQEMISKMSKETLELTENSDVKVELACLNKDIDFLISKDCKFLLNEEMKKDLKDPFFCVYQDKPSGKTESVYDYYFYQNYGVKENVVKQTNTVVKIKNSPKGAGRYYKYILDGLSNKTLKEAKILDFLTEHVLDNMTVSATDESAISAKSVDFTSLSMNESLSDIEHWKKETKKVIESCGVRTNQNIKKIIAKSCEEYEGLLVKQTSKLKAEVLDKGQELLNVLKERTVQKAQNEAVDREIEKRAEEARKAEEEKTRKEAEKRREERKEKERKLKEEEEKNEVKKSDEKKDDKKVNSKKDDEKDSSKKDNDTKDIKKDSEKNATEKDSGKKPETEKPVDDKKPDDEQPSDKK